MRVGVGGTVGLPLAAGTEAQFRDSHLGRGGVILGGPSARVGGLERHQSPGTGLGDRPARDRRREGRRDPVVDHVARVGLVRHAQRDAQIRVRAQVVLDDARGALGGHDQVDAERTAALGDVHDAVDELRHLGCQRGELVDHEDEGRRALRILTLLELEQVLRLLAVEQMLPVLQLGSQARQRAAHQVRAEVGHESDAVRQLDAVRERGTALVVDEEERHAVGAVRRCHAEHPRLEELRLARTGGAADEGVRPLRAQVEDHRVARSLSDDRPKRSRLLQPRPRIATIGRRWCCSAASAR